MTKKPPLAPGPTVRPYPPGKLKLGFATCVCLGALILGLNQAEATDFLVSNPASITAAAAVPGDTITMLTNGLWNNVTITFNKTGTLANPITLRAQVPGQVLITGDSHLYIAGSYLVVDGLVFTNGSPTQANDIIEFRTHCCSPEAHNCRLTNVMLVDLNPSNYTNGYKWVSLYGYSNRVDHCLLRGQNNVGATLTVWLTSVTPSNNCHLIDHNYFDNRTLAVYNDNGESIRVGTSDVSTQSCRTIVESNYFHACSGDFEVISSKSCDNIYRYNTFVDCVGCLTLRHGKRCSAIGNFFFGHNIAGTGGIRIIDSDHTVINNYFQDLGGTDGRAALAAECGIVDSPLDGYFQVSNSVVAFNTIVNCAEGIALDVSYNHYNSGMGPNGTQTLCIANSVVANNVVRDSQSPLVSLPGYPTNLVWQGNIFYGASLGITLPSSNSIVDPKLSSVPDGLVYTVYRPATNSPVIGAALGSYPYVVDDMDGQPRFDPKDVGADQLSTNAITRGPVGPADVGPSWYQVAGDGIPVWWRQQYFGGDGTTTNAQSCATCDPDGDGLNNLQEYLAGSDPLGATDITWTAGDGAYETGGNWSTASVPASTDRAIFDDHAVNALNTVSFGSGKTVSAMSFTSATKSVSWKVGSSSATNTWTIRNQIVFDQMSTATSTGILASGVMTVTNASGTGAVRLGNAATGGRGLFRMELATSGATPPTLIADQFAMTGNADFWFRGGTLTTLGGSTIDRGAQTGFCIGTNSTSTAGAACWNMLGGTNTITYNSGGATCLGYLSSTLGSVAVSGSNTLLSVGGGSLTIGNSGRGALTISDGAHVTSPQIYLSRATNSINNMVTVTGGARWDINGSGENSFGYNGSTNQTSVLDGAAVVLGNVGSVTLGNGSLSSANQIAVSGTNTLFQTGGALFVGIHGSDNTLTVTNRGTVALVGSGSLTMGSFVESTNNLVKISGGSLLVNNATITVGNHGANNMLTIDNGGTVSVSGNLYVSAQTDAVANTVVVSGGNVIVSNGTGSAILDVSHTTSSTGSFTLNAGTVSADRLLVSHGANGQFTFNGGVLNITASDLANNSQINNGAAFVVGDGAHSAVLNLGGGLLSAANGLVISSNATLRGNGTVGGGSLTVNSGGLLSPGNSVGVLTNNGDLVVNSGAALNYDLGTSSDQIVVNGNVSLNGGTLNISDAGGFGVGTYTLITYTDTLSNHGLNIGTKPNPSLVYSIDTSTTGQVDLVVSSPDAFGSWQTHYFPAGGPNAAPGADPDGDGMSNTNEFLAGFNPTNSAAYVHVLAITSSGGDINVTYLGANGDNTWSPGIASRTNVLEYSTGTAGGSYSNNFVSTGQTNILSGGTGSGVITNMVDIGGGTGVTRYYRIRVLLP